MAEGAAFSRSLPCGDLFSNCFVLDASMSCLGARVLVSATLPGIGHRRLTVISQRRNDERLSPQATHRLRREPVVFRNFSRLVRIHRFATLPTRKPINVNLPMVLSETFEPYIRFCTAERLVARSTLSKYRDCFTSWILPVLGHDELATLSAARVLDLRAAMAERKLSVYRMYTVLVCLKSLLKFCRTHLKVDTLDPATVRLPGRGMPTVDYLSNIDVQRVLRVIDVHTYAGARLRALVELLLSTGLRISEALSLSRDTFDARAAETEIVGKGGRRRVVYFSERCHYWIRRYLDKRADSHPALFVTTGLPARPLKREDLSRVFSWLRMKAGIDKKLTPHILRHTFCTNLLHGGADITFIRDLAGHADIQTTARYYLGKNKEKLRQVLNESLDYSRGVDDRMVERFDDQSPVENNVSKVINPQSYAKTIFEGAAPSHQSALCSSGTHD